MPSSSNRMGRIEQALNVTLRESGGAELTGALRGHLRGLARALDTAEAAGDLDATAKVGRTYLESLQAAGLAGVTREALDPFAAFVAGLSAPSMGDTQDTEPP